MTKSTFPEKTMLISQFPDTILYRVACDCGNPQDDTYIEIVYDHNIKYVVLSFICNTHYTYSPYDATIMEKINFYYRRIKDAITILFGGKIKLQSSFLLQSKDHIDNFITAITEGRDILLKENTNENI